MSVTPAPGSSGALAGTDLGYAFEALQDDKALTLVTGNDPQEVRRTYSLDGAATTYPLWQTGLRRETWSLDAAGNLIVAVESADNFMKGRESKRTLTYRKN